jgi:hypothetical protein
MADILQEQGSIPPQNFVPNELLSPPSLRSFATDFNRQVSSDVLANNSYFGIANMQT